MISSGFGATHLPGREIRFEVFVKKAGHWLINGQVEHEATALERVRQLLVDKSHSAAKIVRVRTVLATGFETRAVIFEQLQRTDRPREIRISGPLRQAPFCAKVEDLYGLESRMIISRLLRPFLDRHCLTASEVLYRSAPIKRISRTRNMLSQAVNHVARVQTGGGDMPIRERATHLERLIDETGERAGIAEIENRKLPTLEKQGFEIYLRQMEAAVGPVRCQFLSHVGLAIYAGGFSTWNAKFENLADLLAPNFDPSAYMMLDNILADTLCARATMEAVLGPRGSLADALGVLANLALGRPAAEGPRVSKMLLLLDQLIMDYSLPICRTVIVDRIRRELKSIKSLTKKAPDAELEALLALREQLTDSIGGVLGGPSVARLLSARIAQEELRKATGRPNI